MRVLLVGAGAVGMVLHRALEQQKGNEVHFLVRPGRKAKLERSKIVDARTGELRVRERPTSVEIGQKLPHFDTVLFCVRADQVAAALDDVGMIPPRTRLATITPGPEGLALLRARHPGHPAVRIAPTFMAYTDGDAVVLWLPPLFKTPVSHEGDADSAAFATELAAAFDQGGIPSRAREKMIAGMDSGNDAFMPLLAAYALAGYDADVLRADRALLALTGEAIGEALLIGGAPGIAGAIARRAAAPVIRAALLTAAPRLPESFRAMWRTHAPKIEAQTRATIESLSLRAKINGHTSTALVEMLHRLDARAPANVAPKESA